VSRRALVAGASGLVGSHCLRQLLACPVYGEVTALVRRPLPLTHPRLVQAIIDFDALPAAFPAADCEDVFCCLGTTIRKAGSQAAFRRVDFDYPVALAHVVREHNAQRFLLVSALGASASSRVFYNRVKGEVEQAVQAVEIAHTWCFRPSLLLGERTEHRPAERASILFARLVAPLLRGPLARYRAIDAAVVAAAMVSVAVHGHASGIIESEEIPRLATR
jgi:uncharacterized protein YbjT (DUF2867 family)